MTKVMTPAGNVVEVPQGQLFADDVIAGKSYMRAACHDMPDDAEVTPYPPHIQKIVDDDAAAQAAFEAEQKKAKRSTK